MIERSEIDSREGRMESLRGEKQGVNGSGEREGKVGIIENIRKYYFKINSEKEKTRPGQIKSSGIT